MAQHLDLYVTLDPAEPTKSTVSLQVGAGARTAEIPFPAGVTKADFAQAGWEIGGQDGQVIGTNNLFISHLPPSP